MAKAGNRKAAMGFIFVTLLIDVIGWGIIIPVIPNLLKELTGSDTSQAAEYGGWLTSSFAIMQFLFSPLIGNLSDRYGRRPVLLFSLFGFGIDYLVVAFAPTLGWLFAGRIIAGITGASFTTATAYIADISTNENRAQNFGMIGAAFGLGFYYRSRYRWTVRPVRIPGAVYRCSMLVFTKLALGIFYTAGIISSGKPSKI